MKTNGVHISHILIDYLAQCKKQPSTHEFTIRPERVYFGLGANGILTNVKSLADLTGSPLVVVHVPGELNVLRIHAFESCTAEKAFVYNDDHVNVTEENKARLNGVIACAIYQYSSNQSLTMVNF
jgi:hypothetical protein